MPKGRPQKPRVIGELPKIRQFSPRGRTGRPDYIEIALPELEALRLADYLGYNQKLASQAMGISQQTFSRILKKARKSIANALVNGKIIRIKEDNLAENPRANSV